MSSETPSTPEQPQEEVIQKVNSARQKLSPATTPQRIKAESQSRNSYERLYIVKILAFGLIAALALDLAAHLIVYFAFASDPARSPYTGNTKDILLVISSIAAFLLGKGSNEKNED